MDKELLERLLGVVKDAAEQFGGIYSRIWDGLRKDPNSVSNTAFLSIYKDCKDAMDFALAYEMPESSIYTKYRMPNNARFR
jgi:hypothetical protein